MRLTLLVISHAPSANTQRLEKALADGFQAADTDQVEWQIRSPFDVEPSHIIEASGLILMTPENLGYMSGALKDCFDRCYCPCLELTQGKPYALIVRAGHDGTGSKIAVERIVTGLRWRAVAEPLILKGSWQDEFLSLCRELGQAMVEGLDAGIF